MAAMRYLAELHPKKYELKHTHPIEDESALITLSMVKFHPVEGFPMWQVVHTVWPNKDRTWQEIGGWAK